jgi:Mg/Co/Ni transporter MgtE
VALVGPASRLLGPGGGAGGAAIALLITEISVSTAMLVSLRGAMLTREVLRSSAAGLACAAVVVVLDHLLAPHLGAWRYPLDGLAYLALAAMSGALQLDELRQVVIDGLRRERRA